MKKKAFDPDQKFTAAEISHALHYMMVNELSHSTNGLSCDERYINGFVKRLFKNIEEDRKLDSVLIGLR